MDLLSIFSADEVQNLRLSIIRVFNIVANSDGKIDKKELANLDLVLSKSKNFDSDLARDLFSSPVSISTLQEQRDLSGLKDREGIRYISALLDRKMERELAIPFKKTLIAIAYYIASASGGFLQHKVNDDESSSLNLLAKDLDLSLRELLNSNQLTNIISKITN